MAHEVSPHPWSLGPCTPVSRLSLGQSTATVLASIYEDPDAVRAFALRIPHWSRGRGQYPGHFLFTPIATRFYCSLISSVVGKPVLPHREYQFAPFAMIRDVGGDFQVSESMPHCDEFCDYVSIISLSTPEDVPATVLSGTSFWRHSPTGLTSMPRDLRRKEREKTFSERPDACWERIGFVPHQYNHMTVFSARAFHRIEFANAEAASVRLTQNLYVVTSE